MSSNLLSLLAVPSSGRLPPWTLTLWDLISVPPRRLPPVTSDSLHRVGTNQHLRQFVLFLRAHISSFKPILKPGTDVQRFKSSRVIEISGRAVNLTPP